MKGQCFVFSGIDIHILDTDFRFLHAILLGGVLQVVMGIYTLHRKWSVTMSNYSEFTGPFHFQHANRWPNTTVEWGFEDRESVSPCVESLVGMVHCSLGRCKISKSSSFYKFSPENQDSRVQDTNKFVPLQTWLPSLWPYIICPCSLHVTSA